MRSGTPVLIDGVRTTVVGRVSMDMTAVDLTQLPQAEVGDEVTLWGAQLGAEEVAPFADTIAYELICGISQRVAVEWKA
jgi:alanine racemase